MTSVPALPRFTALAECPRCHVWAVHPFRLPQRQPELPDGPSAVVWRNISAMHELFTVLTLGAVPTLTPADECRAETVRQCWGCGAEWANT